MVIYLDLVMAVNFFVDLLLILGTNRLCGFPSGIVRASAAAAMGAVYSAFAMIPGFFFLGNTLWRTVFLSMMGILAFGFHKSAWKRTGIFLLLSMAMGGVALGLDRKGIPALLLSAASVWLLSRMGFGGTVGGKEYIPVTVTAGERTVMVPDVGEKLLGLDVEALRKPLESLHSHSGLRLIPYSAVGQPAGFLLAKRFENVKIGEHRRSALVAFAPEAIGAGQPFEALAGGMI